MTALSVLLADGDHPMAETVARDLETEGFRVCCEETGEAVCTKILSDPPDLVILETGLMDMSGFEVCKRIRHRYSGGILFLTDSREDLDQLLAFELGADDFVSKPIHPRVLHARVKSLIQRCRSQSRISSIQTFQLGDLRVSRINREVRLKDRLIDLTTHEFDLLWLLVTHAGDVVSRDAVYRSLYNCEYNGTDRSVDVYISRIRQKIGDDPAAPVYLKTVRGVGYLFAGELSQ